MELVYNKELIRKQKELFLAGEQPNSALVKPEILASWNRCRGLGLDPATAVYPESAYNKNVAQDITAGAKYIRKKSEHLYQMKFELLSQFGIAVFFINEHLCAFAKGGNPALLGELKARGLRFSTVFSEELLGNNASALALRTQRPSVVQGEEHYCKALCRYAGFSFPYLPPRPVDNSFAQNAYINTYIMPVDNITPLHLSLIHFLGENDFYSEPTQIIKNLAFEYTSQAKQNGYILTDEQGIVVELNPLCHTFFALNPENAYGKAVEELLPELKTVMSRLFAREEVNSESVIFHLSTKEKTTFSVSGVTLKREGETIGFALTLTDMKYIQQNASKVVNKGAYYTFEQIIGNNKKFQENKRLAQKIAQGSSNVLICGESGTGKELFAQSIHSASPRREGPFVSINCAAIPTELISSELFGYEEGAFTGAKKGGAMGKFEQAHLGTLFLDEIAEMPLDMQSVLLRVIEERTVSRVGSAKTRDVDVRIIAATNRDLQLAIRNQKFRMDLYYRLNVMRIDLVPLRQRMDDIPILVNYMVMQISQSAKRDILSVEQEVMDCFTAYHWPGNLRELRNVIERCINLESEGIITMQTVPLEMKTPQPLLSPEGQRPGEPSAERQYASYEALEEQNIRELMHRYRGNKTLVAKELGITRATLYRKLDKISSWT